MPGFSRPAPPLRMLTLFLLLVLAVIGTHVQAAPAQQYAVFLYDGRIPNQMTLDEVVRAALKPHAARLPLRTLHAGKADSLPFMRPQNLMQQDAPLFLVLNGPGDTAKVVKRIRLKADDEPETAVNSLLKSLGLPIPKLSVVPTGSVFRIATDGGSGEETALVSTRSTEVDAEAHARKFLTSGIAVYRVRIPATVQRAELRAEIGGSYVVEWSPAPEGPWRRLMDSARYFEAAEGALAGRMEPVADLAAALEGAGGTRYLRVQTAGRGEAVLARLEIVALAKDQPSGEDAWLTHAAKVRTEKLGQLLPNGGKATALSGVLEKDTTLDRKRSPYLLGGDLVVAEGVTLTVEPGVVVWTVGRRTLRVEGRLVAVGSRTEPIQFLPAAPAGPDDWRGIQIRPKNSGKLEPSRLEYCRVVNAEAVSLEQFSGEVSHCVLEGGLVGVALRGGSQVKAHHNRFVGCFQGLVIDGGTGEANGNQFQECHVGLFVGTQAKGQSFRFEGNSITGSRIAAVNYLPLAGISSPPLALPGNHWEAVADRLVARGGGEVNLEPRLMTAPAGVGPGF